MYDFIRKIIFSRRLEALEKKKNRYKKIVKKEEILDYQLKQLNRVWTYCITEIPFYVFWKEKHNLPSQITSIKELKSFPLLTKADLVDSGSLMLEGLEDYYLTSTGGTSGLTLHFPTSKLDADEAYVNAYLGRSWWNINPFDSIVMLWGHSHLFGNGYGKHLKQLKRRLFDFIINTYRISSYKLDLGNLKLFIKIIIKINPKIIISYSSNIFKLCKYLESHEDVIKNNNLKYIILTSETVTSTEVTLINKYMNAEVINEYGMAETGVIAYSHLTTDNIRVLWDSFLVLSGEDGSINITTINNKKFPLINYDTEDLMDVKEDYYGSVLFIKNILGKSRNILKVRMLDGTISKISTIYFDHILKFYPNVYSIQYKQFKNFIEINLVSNTEVDFLSLQKFFESKAGKFIKHIDFRFIKLKTSKESQKTIAGKAKVLG